MVEDRKLAVLRAIVEDYVSTQEPVGSKSLVDRHQLGVSPATVRNDMAALEEEGFITQPHTSAGRIPTDKGYRLFVDRLSQVKPLSVAEKRAIATLLEGAIDLDDVVQRSVRLLAQLTRQVAIVQYPTLSRSTVRHVELVPLTATTVLVVLILSHRSRRAAGRRAARGARRGRDRRSAQPAQPRGRSGERHRRRRRALAALPEDTDPATGRWCRCWSPRWSRPCPTTAPTSGSWSAAPRTSPASATVSTLAIRPMLEALEEHVVLLKLLGEASVTGDGDGADRARGALRGARVDRPSSPPATDRATRRWRPSASWGRPAWTTQGRWRRCARSRTTSPRSSTKDDESSVSQDLYETPRGLPRRRRRHDQEGLPQAGPPAAPRRQPRPGDAGAVQERHARLRGALRPREAPDVRPRRRPVHGGGGFGGAGAGAGFSFTDIMDAFFGGQAGGAPGPRARVRGPGVARTR